MKKGKGFTLAELLIVIIIIGILSSAVLPKITWYLAKTRDLKRQMDLRSIATAIEIYKDQHGGFPLIMRSSQNIIYNIFGSAQDLSPILKDYIHQIPSDPNKNNFVDITVEDIHLAKKYLKPWEYFYQVGQKNWMQFWVAVLVAKPETADGANYVLLDRNYHTNRSKDGVWLEIYWNNEPLKTIKTIEDMNFCETIEKVKNKTEEQPATKENKNCKYTDQKQLFYIHRIE